MVARTTLKERVGKTADPARVGNYFAGPKTKLKFIPTGSKVLDLALGGGWAENRIANIVGDKSTGKTLLAIEAIANFAMKYATGKIYYREAEAAFDNDYAEALGMPLNRVNFGQPMETVEDFFEDMTKVIEKSKGVPSLYILDSLDALSDRAEMDRAIDKGTYGANKPKQLSEMFRRLVRQMTKANITLIVISQVRSKIGISFGRNTTRSGGRALDFYSSQVLYLVHIGAITKAIKGIKRPTGIRIKSKCDKNKVGLPLREASFSVLFGYGINDRGACITWLKDNRAPLKDSEGVPLKKLHELVEARWWEIEVSFLPTKKKYG